MTVGRFTESVLQGATPSAILLTILPFGKVWIARMETATA